MSLHEVSGSLLRESSQGDPSPSGSPVRAPSDGFVGLALIGVAAIAVGVGLACAQILPAKDTLYLGGGLLGLALIGVFVRFFWYGILLTFTVRASLDHLKQNANSLVSPASVLGGVVLAASVVWLWQKHRAGELRPFTGTARALAYLTAVPFIGCVIADYPFASISAGIRLASTAILVMVLQQLFREDPRKILPLIAAVFLSIIGPGLVGMLQLIGNKPVVPAYGPPIPVGRIEGTFVHPNAFATFLVVVLPIGVALLPHFRGWFRVGLCCVIAGSGGLLLFTYARAAWAAAIVGLMIVGAFQDRRIIFMALTAIGVGFLAVPSIPARLSDLFKSHPKTVAVNPNSLTWRFYYWGKVIHLFPKSPILGIGLDSVQRVEPDQLPPHSVFIQSLVEGGVVGFLAVLNVIRSAIAGIHRHAIGNYDPLGQSLRVAAIASGVGFFIQMFTENLLTETVSQWYVIVVLAWALSVPGTSASTWDGTWYETHRRPNRRPSPALV